MDPILSLAFSMHSNKGVYVPLLGSGISRAAGIPTGWEVVLDLIRKLASMEKENCEPDPAVWYKNRYGSEPHYSEILDAIARTPAERSQLLKTYFEPSEEEREGGLKIPTIAHKSIAHLVAEGYIRIIVTTNFDRLIEKALEEIGVTPIVISTPESIEGVLPLVHTGCLVVKVHGDYLDTRIKNTSEELKHYDKPLNSLLDRIVDEFGLIICGWSGEWDIALRKCIERCKSRRFSIYWAARNEPGNAAKRLLGLRQGEVIKIKDADRFFQDLEEKVLALEDLRKPHPLSVKVAVASLKKFLPEERHKIRMHDLVMGETEKLFELLSEENFPSSPVFSSKEEFKRRVSQYESLVEVLLTLIVTGCYWGRESHDNLWVKSLERIARSSENQNGIVDWLHLRAYPALLLLYGGGIAAICAKQYGTLKALITQPMVKEEPIFKTIYPEAVIDSGKQVLLGMERRHTPISDHIHNVLRKPLKDLIPDDKDYDECFDRYEYLFALVYADMREKTTGAAWGPFGRFAWRNKYGREKTIMAKIDEELRIWQDTWPPLKVSLFHGIKRLQEVKTEYDKHINNLGWGW